MEILDKNTYINRIKDIFFNNIITYNSDYFDSIGNISLLKILQKDNIDNKEMQECINMSYDRDTRILVTRGGLSPTVQSFTSPIKSLAFDNETGVTFIFLDNKEVYKSEDTSTSEYIGKYYQ